MVVCSYFLKGSCKFGNTCRNSHVVDGANKTANTSALPGPDSFETISRTMQDDLTTERPLYYLSVYSPHKSAINMIDGTDVSPEELRFQAYQARANNTTSQYVAHESQLLQQMDSVIKTVTQNCKESYKHFYHTQLPLNHPSSTFRKPTPGVTSFGGSGFGSNNQPTAFGQAGSGFGGPSTGAFGAFGSQAANPTVSAFGQPSSVRPTISAFGQQTSAFATQPSAQPGTATAFGKPSAFGSPAPLVSAFGAPSAPSAFGQPSQFGTASAFGAASSQTTTAFGTSPQPTGATAFGSTPQPTGTNAFGTNTQSTGTTAFGTPAQPVAATAFGAVSQPSGATAFGSNVQSAPTNSAGAFGQTSLNNTSTAFGQPANQATSFGQSSAFGQPQTPNAFGKPSAFGQSAFGKPSAFGQSPFGQSAPFGTPVANPSATPVATTAFGQSSGFGGSSAPFSQATPSMTTPPNNQANTSSGGGGGGFAAFAGAANPSMATSFTNNQAATTPPGPAEDSKPVVSAFGQPMTPSKPSALPNTSSFFGSANQVASSSNPNPSSSVGDRAPEKFKLLDPFWQDAPTEADLSPALLEAFRAEFFAWDFIPDVPPPITLR
ncbi:hypothetical protein PGT21_014493 [Puccinia graminis f. sp. tritici]|uniref:C3H1-type domain-containing protein n=2 Tax=Puccinia graminis f. sp. tritici TaxID=56615 RepID=A0A5B0P2A4_PUCGR|nr:hypothetical protein PGTUg99_022683 [Puccinia graminis f. sp. tritici]KAA1094238.1 hypothetical protein PGT21_014493 [Puccinia graminis f. sp. tritici]